MNPPQPFGSWLLCTPEMSGVSSTLFSCWWKMERGPQPVFSAGLPLCRWDLGSDEDLFPHGDDPVCRCSAKLTGSFSRAHRCQQHKKPGFSVCSPVFGASFNVMLSAVTMVLPFFSGDAGPAGKQANFPNCPPTVSGAERKQPSSPASSFLWV